MLYIYIVQTHCMYVYTYIYICICYIHKIATTKIGRQQTNIRDITTPVTGNEAEFYGDQSTNKNGRVSVVNPIIVHSSPMTYYFGNGMISTDWLPCTATVTETYLYAVRNSVATARTARS